MKVSKIFSAFPSFILFLIFFLYFFSCGVVSDENIRMKEVVFQGIRLKVLDDQTGEPLPSRVVIKNSEGRVVESYYDHLPGIFTNEDGTLEIELSPGDYSSEVIRGIDYTSTSFSFGIRDSSGYDIELDLEPWIDLRGKGWVNGGGHCHLYTDVEEDSQLLMKVRQICRAQGVDFLCAAQGWAGYGDDNWSEGYQPFSDENFLLHYGSEMPKYRTGHTWWIGQESTRGYFWNTMDENYEKSYFRSEEGHTWNFDDLDFPYVPGTEVVQRIRQADDAVAIMAHPTSWWWQERGNTAKYTTNVASYLSFGLLAGKIWDGLVIMGYNHDHYYYQNLWFSVLNEGYFMPAISELDEGPDRDDRFYYGSMRTYYGIEGDFNIDKVANAVRKGRTFVSSGPVILGNIDGRYHYGDVVPVSDRNHTLDIEAFASGEQEEYLSYLVIYRNGEIFKYWDLRNEKPRIFRKTLEISENEDSWYVIKAYGRKAWEDPKFLDIVKVCNKEFEGSLPASHGDLHDVCITSPFYFRKAGFTEPLELKPLIHLTLKDDSGYPGKTYRLEILSAGRVTGSFESGDPEFSFEMPLGSVLRISDRNGTTLYRDLYLDYEPHRNLLEELANGDWLAKAGKDFSSGEVPWEAFQFNRTRELFSGSIDWVLSFRMNDRDFAWEEFDKLFSVAP